MTDLPDGWTVAPGADGHTVASKWFGDHYKTVEVADGNDLVGAVAGVEQEAQLRAQAGADADRGVAEALRAEADRIDPDVATAAPVTAGPVTEPAPVAEAPATPVVVPSVEELRAAAETAPVEESAPAEPVSALSPDPEPAAVAAPATEGA